MKKLAIAARTLPVEPWAVMIAKCTDAPQRVDTLRFHTLVCLQVITFMLQQLLQPITFAQFATALFVAILFLQSGLDKVFNFADNLGWLTGHFSKTPFRNQVKAMLVTITVAEMLAGLLAMAGAVQIAWSGQLTCAMYGAQLATIDIVLLFFGQRIAKDYAGAASLVPYFILCVADVLLLTL